MDIFGKTKRNLAVLLTVIVGIPMGYGCKKKIEGESPQISQSYGRPKIPSYRHEKDNSEMVYVPFFPAHIVKSLGENLRHDWEDDNKPFWIDKYEITNSQYQRFVRETDHKPPPHWKSSSPPKELEDHPVVNVSWDSANAYAVWAGKRLPTHEQWVRAAAYDGNTLRRVYPWADSLPLSIQELKEFAQVWAYNEEVPTLGEFKVGTSPVGTHPKGRSYVGAEDLIGNAEEWTTSEMDGPPGSGSHKFIVGGGWNSDGIMGRPLEINLLKEYATHVNTERDSLGFRCILHANER